MDDIAYVYISVGAWLTLGGFIYFMFVRLQISERDTLVGEEAGKTPIFESVGRGAMNRARPVRKPFARITLYDSFLAACLKSQRKAVAYKDIREMSLQDYGGRTWLYIKATDDGTELEILFNADNQEKLLEQIELRRKAS